MSDGRELLGSCLSDFPRDTLELLRSWSKDRVQSAVCYKDPKGWTPLHWTCFKGHIDVVRVLLGHNNVDVNAKTDDDYTPLHWACIHDHADVVRELLKHDKINVNIKDKDGWTPLHEACCAGHADVVQELLGHDKVDVTITDRKYQTALKLARAEGHAAEIEPLFAAREQRLGASTAAPSSQPPASKPAAATPQSDAARRPPEPRAQTSSSSAPAPAPSRATAVRAPPSHGPDIFISLRFGETLPAGQALKARLEASGLRVFLCAVQAGGDLVDEIVRNIDQCRLVVVMGSRTYGKDTGVGFCTADELKFIMSEQKEVFLVKMCDRFEEALARFRLGSNVMYHAWMPTTNVEQRHVPDALVAAILNKLASI